MNEKLLCESRAAAGCGSCSVAQIGPESIRRIIAQDAAMIAMVATTELGYERGALLTGKDIHTIYVRSGVGVDPFLEDTTLTAAKSAIEGMCTNG